MLRRRNQDERRAGAVNLDSSDLPRQIDTWINSHRTPLGQIILERGWITPEQLVRSLQAENEEGRRLGDVLLSAGIISDEQLAEALAQQFAVPIADLKHVTPQQEAVDKVPEEVARRLNAIPMTVDGDRVFVALPDPLDVQAIKELTLACGRIGVLIGVRSDIVSIIDRTYNVLRNAEQAIQAFELSDDSPAQTDQGEAEADENAPIVQVVNRVITQGVRSRASDIHIEPEEGYIRVRYRVDGAMNEAITLPARMGAPMSSRIKVMAGMNIVERRRPQDGQFRTVVDGRPIDVRTSTVATVHGEKVVMRLLDKSRALIGLDQLGMSPDTVEPYLKIVKAPLGMMLCTGPTGSGKTTTLYATLTEVNDPHKNVVTIEDPVEYQFAGVNQIQVSDAAGITFADGLRGILRQDPDVILLGEIRDIETARIAMQASLTGHLVLSSLHAVDAVAALHRFTDMGLEPFLVASAVTGVIGQRLLRTICEACKQDDAPPSDQVRLVASQLATSKATFKRGAGCNLCGGTGYLGRVGVYELLVVSDDMRQLIVDKATHREMRRLAVKEGMRTMQVQAFQLVADGVTTVDEVYRSVYAQGMSLGEQSPMGELMPGKGQLGPGAGAIESGPDALEPGGDDLEEREPIELGPAGGTLRPVPDHDDEMSADNDSMADMWEVGA